VAYDVERTGHLVSAPEGVAMIPDGSFRTVRRAVYDRVVAAVPALGPFFENVLGLDPSVPGDLPIPTTGEAAAFATAIDFEPQRTHTVATTQVTYNVPAPRPFCVPPGSSQFVLLKGPLTFTMSVSTGPSGRYERTYSIGGTLEDAAIPAGRSLPVAGLELCRGRHRPLRPEPRLLRRMRWLPVGPARGGRGRRASLSRARRSGPWRPRSASAGPRTRRPRCRSSPP